MSTELDLMRPLPVGRRLLDSGLTAIALGLTALALLPLGSVLGEIIQRGWPGLKLDLFTALPAPIGVTDVANGFANALVGTLQMVFGAALLSIPLALMTAIYLSEIDRNSRLKSIVRFVLGILSAVPSIVVGVFAYAVVVKTSGTFSAVAGSVALGLIMLPVIALASEEALRQVALAQRLASAALGANTLQTTLYVVVKAALPGITTGILLATARAVGETAPLLFTALFSQNWPESWLKPTASLSVLIFNYANSGFPEQTTVAWSASLVLLTGVLVLSFCSRLLLSLRK